MPTEDGMKSVMQQYIDGFNKKDAKVLYSLFADNARIEDPVGGDKIVEGTTAIEELYKGAVTMVDKLELSAPVRASHGAQRLWPSLYICKQTTSQCKYMSSTS